MTEPLFRRLLGGGMDALPPALQAVHDAHDNQCWHGVAEVTLSRNPVARLLCVMMRLPAEGRHVPVAVRFERTGKGERWHRTFAGRRYRSDLFARGIHMVERMGAATNIFRVSTDEGQLCLDLEGFRFLGVPMPRYLRPHCHARDREENGRYVFDIPVSIPWLGFVIRYTGHIERCDD
jgi:hypothetical protein